MPETLPYQPKLATILTVIAVIIAVAIGIIMGFLLATPCATEDSLNCTWYADLQGSGGGRTFTDVFGLFLFYHGGA